jgi:hypothetical protein
MARPQLILPQADASCGKMFFPDRRTADGHRIALEVWNRATGREREGYRLAVYRCKRCHGFHIGQRPVDRISPRTLPVIQPEDDFDGDVREPFDDSVHKAPRIHRAAVAESARW